MSMVDGDPDRGHAVFLRLNQAGIPAEKLGNRPGVSAPDRVEELQRQVHAGPYHRVIVISLRFWIDAGGGASAATPLSSLAYSEISRRGGLRRPRRGLPVAAA